LKIFSALPARTVATKTWPKLRPAVCSARLFLGGVQTNSSRQTESEKQRQKAPAPPTDGRIIRIRFRTRIRDSRNTLTESAHFIEQVVGTEKRNRIGTDVDVAFRTNYDKILMGNTHITEFPSRMWYFSVFSIDKMHFSYFD